MPASAPRPAGGEGRRAIRRDARVAQYAASEAVRLAAEEGLTLVRRPDGSFRVSHTDRTASSAATCAKMAGSVAPKHVLEYRDSLNRARRAPARRASAGRFATAEAAALAFARCFGPQLSAKMAAESMASLGRRIMARDEPGRIVGSQAQPNEPKAAGDGQPTSTAGAKRKRMLRLERCGPPRPPPPPTWHSRRSGARCSLLNGARMRRCEACGNTRQVRPTRRRRLARRPDTSWWAAHRGALAARQGLVPRAGSAVRGDEGLARTGLFGDGVREVLDLKKEEWGRDGAGEDEGG